MKIPSPSLAALLAPLSLAALSACATVSTSEVVRQDDEVTAAESFASGNAHFQAGRWNEAAAAYADAVAEDEQLGDAWFQMGYALHAAGRLEEAIPAHERAATFPRHAPLGSYNLGCAHALLGHTDAAFEALGKAAAAGFAQEGHARGDTDLASLHGDPRWEPWLASLSGTADEVGEDGGDGVYRALDFWVGEWDVKSRDGKLLGTNSITSDLNGYLVHEEWTSAGGHRGRSINYYDRDAKEWTQTWISEDGSVLNMSGTFADGSMRLVGRHAYKQGGTVDHRTTLTPLADGRVRQFIEESKDGGTTWTVGFEGFYTRRDV